MFVHSTVNIHLCNSMHKTDPAAKQAQKQKKKKEMEMETHLNTGFSLNSRQGEFLTQRFLERFKYSCNFNQRTQNCLLSTQPKNLFLKKGKKNSTGFQAFFICTKIKLTSPFSSLFNSMLIKTFFLENIH